MQFSEVKELIAIFEKTDLNDMEVHLDNAIVRLNRGKVPLLPPMPPVMQGHPEMVSYNTQAPFAAGSLVPSDKTGTVTDTVTEEKAQDARADGGANYIKAPIVGTFYQSASPEKPPYVNEGDKIKKGDIVCIIEAMKFMNEVTSEEDGEIAEILVEDGEFVEYGAPLFRLK